MAEKIICVVGPTACGKTKLGVLLAKRYDGEVVSADSMQIYKGMTIGTAAPTAEEMEGVPHHMIAVADPAEQWSAARYARAAVPIVDDILRRGKRPILVGGTGLWLDAVVLVPGLVFDRKGNRYGYGGGYYDRYFARFPKLSRMAVAFEGQIEEQLAVLPTDVRMHRIYTEEREYRI